MKPLLLWTLGLLGVAGAARGQALRGGYVLATASGCDEFFYFADGRFRFCGGCCLGLYYGSGTYQLQADSLRLQFDAWQLPAVTATAVPAFQADSTTSGLVVQLVDAATGKPLPRVSIMSETIRKVGTSADEQGIARLPIYMPPDGKLRLNEWGLYTSSHERGPIMVDFSRGNYALIKLHPVAGHRVENTTYYAFLVKYPARGSLLLHSRWSDYKQATKRQTRHYLAEYRKLTE